MPEPLSACAAQAAGHSAAGTSWIVSDDVPGTSSKAQQHQTAGPQNLLQRRASRGPTGREKDAGAQAAAN
eukprot:5603002-Lingulodinium_polyedra.AAC.1